MNAKLRKSAKDLRYYTAKMLTFKAHADQRNNRAKQPTNQRTMSEATTVKGIVKSAQAAGNFTSKTGKDAGKVKYKFDITLDNGMAGQMTCLTEELDGTECPVKVGEEREFNVYANSNPSYADNWYLKKAKSDGGFKGGGGKWTPDPEKENRKERWAKQLMITRMGCLNTAASLISAGNGDSSTDNLIDLAKTIEGHVLQGLNIEALQQGK